MGLWRSVVMLGCVGNDAFGRELSARLLNEGVDTAWVDVIEKVETGVAAITVAGGDNAIVVIPGANHRLSEAHVQAAERVIRDADVEVAIGGEQDAVDAALDEALLCSRVGKLDARGASRAAAGAQCVDGGGDGGLILAGGRWQHDACAIRIGHQRDAVLRAHLIDQQLERGFEQRELVGAVHRAGHVDQKDEVGGRQILFRHVLPLDGDAQHGVQRLASDHGNASEAAVSEVGLSDEFDRHVNFLGRAPPCQSALT